MVKGVQKIVLYPSTHNLPAFERRLDNTCIWCICWFVFCRTCLVLCPKYDRSYEHYTLCLFLFIWHLNFELFLILFGKTFKKTTGNCADDSRIKPEGCILLCPMTPASPGDLWDRIPVWSSQNPTLISWLF